MQQVLNGMEETTLVTLWVFSLLCIVLISCRLGWRFGRAKELSKDDKWMAGSLIFIIVRLVLVHFTTTYKTNNFNHAEKPESSMSVEEERQRLIGSILILPGRIAYAGFVWCMKVCMLSFYERLTSKAKPYGLIINLMYLFLAISFIVVVCSTLLECRPIRLYWTVYPDPGSCKKATAQLVTMGAMNLTSDLILILIPIPMVLNARLPTLRKIQLVFLFGAGFFCASITIIRLPVIVGKSQGLQNARSLWASIECFTACLVANAPAINSFFHKIQHRHEHSATTRRRGNGTRQPNMPVTGQNSRGSLTRQDFTIEVGLQSRTWGMSYSIPYRSRSR